MKNLNNEGKGHGSEEINALRRLAHESMPVGTIGDLIEVLKELPQDAPIMSVFNDPLEVSCVNYGYEEGIFLGFVAIDERD